MGEVDSKMCLAMQSLTLNKASPRGEQVDSPTLEDPIENSLAIRPPETVPSSSSTDYPLIPRVMEFRREDDPAKGQHMPDFTADFSPDEERSIWADLTTNPYDPSTKHCRSYDDDDDENAQVRGKTTQSHEQDIVGEGQIVVLNPSEEPDGSKDHEDMMVTILKNSGKDIPSGSSSPPHEQWREITRDACIHGSSRLQLSCV